MAMPPDYVIDGGSCNWKHKFAAGSINLPGLPGPRRDDDTKADAEVGGTIGSL